MIRLRPEPRTSVNGAGKASVANAPATAVGDHTNGRADCERRLGRSSAPTGKNVYAAGPTSTAPRIHRGATADANVGGIDFATLLPRRCQQRHRGVATSTSPRRRRSDRRQDLSSRQPTGLARPEPTTPAVGNLTRHVRRSLIRSTDRRARHGRAAAGASVILEQLRRTTRSTFTPAGTRRTRSARNRVSRLGRAPARRAAALARSPRAAGCSRSPGRAERDAPRGIVSAARRTSAAAARAAPSVSSADGDAADRHAVAAQVARHGTGALRDHRRVARRRRRRPRSRGARRRGPARQSHLCRSPNAASTVTRSDPQCASPHGRRAHSLTVTDPAGDVTACTVTAPSTSRRAHPSHARARRSPSRSAGRSRLGPAGRRRGGRRRTTRRRRADPVDDEHQLAGVPEVHEAREPVGEEPAGRLDRAGDLQDQGKKKQQKKGCPYKSKRFTTSGARAKLNLRKPFRKKKIPVGTKITITVTAAGLLGKRFTVHDAQAARCPKSRVRASRPAARSAAAPELTLLSERLFRYSRKGRSNSVESTICVCVRVIPGRSRRRSSVSSRWGVSRARTWTTALASPATV